jgi:FAD dependent oxidoreductase
MRVVVLGAGIHGSAVAAVFVALGEHTVTLIDRHEKPVGATSTNHGRVHMGTNTWRNGPDAVTRRRYQASELLRKIPGAVYAGPQGYHLVEDSDDAKKFHDECSRLELPHKEVDKRSLSHEWFDKERFASIFEVPEFAFNPARLASRLVSYARTGRASIRLGVPVLAVEPGSESRYEVILEDGEMVPADIVINALGSWCNQLESKDLPLPRIKLQWDKWSLLVLDQIRSGVPFLERVLTVVDREGDVEGEAEKRDYKPAALPHGRWIALGCDVKPNPIDGPNEIDSKGTVPNPRPFDKENREDALIFEKTSMHFKPLRGTRFQDIEKNMISFWGIMPRHKNCIRGTKEWHTSFEIYPSPDSPNSSKIPGYYCLFGGNATGGLLDAFDVVQRALNLSQVHVETLKNHLMEKMSGIEEDLLMSTMIWE